ncbi:hypothetical protein BV98_000168 [Sphingobium herbicidovorans NBRC 16415]|uniref:DUF1178 family protein n=1 Tax=Sphingobium herbicidovorans (strain ATCC 700291 / DSM 11019 / CCUG 56400 / KCTC 2939 / LMG 18315 / NBRC 16415 / MH) TaxID=1219045 RepID=A0A086PEV0_SPHHM|nr:DUF1178 family protein [Sphingobium herbicidovorans]KFG91918.1 hypothetical protein BV98_000168 [Sphingobium herbicidovorans NBRC 16415]
MIVFDLKCSAHGHVFEAWFGSTADFEDQSARGLLLCPMCGDPDVSKAVMAPAVAAKGNRRPAETPVPAGPTAPVALAGDETRMREIMQSLAEAQAKVLEDSTWVGRGFAEHARAMHYGEKDRASIHGEVAPEEARALISEGVEVAPLLFPVVPPEAKN